MSEGIEVIHSLTHTHKLGPLVHTHHEPVRPSVCLQRALEPPDVHHERLLPVSVAGLIVNLVGIFVFQHGGHGHSHGEDGDGASC